MNETRVKERVNTAIAEEAPAPQLPAVQQERRPRAPRVTAPQYPAAIAKAILKISGSIGEIIKEGQNTFQNYRYAKWEDVNAKLSPLLAEHGLIITQSELSRSLLESNEKGSVLGIVYHFTIVNEDGDHWPPVEWTGIARLRDGKGVTDDKAATKCHTQAEKYFCVKQFKIRVAEENAADRSHTLPKKDARELYTKLQDGIDETESVVELSAWGKDPENIKRKKMLPTDWQDIITTRYNEKLAELNGGPKVVWEEVDPETGEVMNFKSVSGDAEAPAPTPQHTQPPGAGVNISDERYGLAQAAAMRGRDDLVAFAKTCTAAERKYLADHQAELEALYPKEDARS